MHSTYYSLIDTRNCIHIITWHLKFLHTSPKIFLQNRIKSFFEIHKVKIQALTFQSAFLHEHSKCDKMINGAMLLSKTCLSMCMLSIIFSPFAYLHLYDTSKQLFHKRTNHYSAVVVYIVCISPFM